MEHLQHFAQSILDYLENKGKKPDWFNSYFGLCFNWDNYNHHHKQGNHHMLGDAFKHCGMHREYPFNGDFWDYDNELEKGTVYKNPERLAFLHKLAKGEI